MKWSDVEWGEVKIVGLLNNMFNFSFCCCIVVICIVSVLALVVSFIVVFCVLCFAWIMFWIRVMCVIWLLCHTVLLLPPG
jgi:hypothetical protein